MDVTGELRQTIVKYKLFEPGDRIVVAASGGPDSTALLHLLFLLSGEAGWRLAVAHANHGFRPDESAREAEFVRRQAERLELPFYYRELDVPGYLKQHGGNSQDAARRLRYDFLADTARVWQAEKIALAHHADDQAETVLMRILRGTGVSGLGGMSFVQERDGLKLVRPLLRMDKNRLLRELERLQEDYVTDSSNACAKYTRNRIRLETLPFLSKHNPSVVQALNRLAETAAADDDFLEGEAVRAVAQLARQGPEEVRFSRPDFACLHVALQRRFIKLILNYLFGTTENLDFAAVEQIRLALLEEGAPNRRMTVSGKICLDREYDAVRLGRSPGSAAPRDYVYPLPAASGQFALAETGGRLEIALAPAADMASETACSHEARFDAEELLFPLQLRNRRPGDRMQVDGLNGSKKVKDIFIDDKVPRFRREHTPVVTDAGGVILWIPGIRRAGAAKVTENTKQILRLRYSPPPDG
ncbi:tRNA lysidine(34) synthetase TilS [Paenibacillus sp. YN15]|uniref:tRNA lysidine(34) synthetase TilS n=1 Tax=Paenibacillus sp. YN15 TaxID=1742774 RepID=UPI0015EC0165|nr:tRNA lysidine(34) synthetase TilS [Paenibacillus sp. YN15]